MEIMERNPNSIGFHENQEAFGGEVFKTQQGYFVVSKKDMCYLPEGQDYQQSEDQMLFTPLNSNVDTMAIRYFDDHNSRFHIPNTDLRECGGVIRNNGAVMGPINFGTTEDVIGPLLQGLGISNVHEGPIRAIAASYAADNPATETRSNQFRDELNDYMVRHQLSPWIINGLVHCHPRGGHFSAPDKYLSRYFNIPVYVANNRRDSGNSNIGPAFSNFWRFNGHSMSSTGTRIASRP